MTKSFYKIIIVICLAAVFLCSSCVNGERLRKEGSHEIKLGFTTQNFLEVSDVSLESSLKFVNYACENDYDWIELRDPDVCLSETECAEIARYARSKNIEMVYSSQRGLLDSDFIDVFELQAKRAALFSGPGFCRALAANREYSSCSAKMGWTEEEFHEAINRVHKASDIAARYGLTLVVENSNGDIDGRGKPYYGFAEILEQSGENVLWQFDTANFFTNSQIDITPEQVKKLLDEFGYKLSYVHLKSARNGTSQQTLTCNPLPFNFVFSRLAENDCEYVAIELASGGSEEDVYRNLSESMRYLEKSGFVNKE
ncbi:MAG: sugar phosphate isomerase/epimerase family protein [Sedimentisphaeraceae bacterium JB056]